MRQTNSSIFTRVLAMVLCLVMLAGIFTSCSGGTNVGDDHSVNAGGNGEDKNPTENPKEEPKDDPTDDPTDDPVVDPVDPNEIFSASTEITESALIYGTLANNVTIGNTDNIGAFVPASVKIEQGAESLALSVRKAEDEALDGAISNLDVHISGVASDNTVPMLVTLGMVLDAGIGATELKLYHIEDGEAVLMTRVNSASDFAIHNQYTYNAETGEVSIYVASFSVFTAVQSTASKWDENTVADTSWYNENDTEFTLDDVADFLGFRDLVDGGNNFAGKTVTLATDIDLAGKLFNPIGGGWAYNDGKTFNGTFDGGNHTIYNLYVNGWELDETEDKHSCTSMGAGLFSSIHNATIKNIAVVGSELVVETTSIGIIAGCAQGQCTFENIVVSDATLGNYQMRNGGIVGDIYVIASDNVPEGEYSHTFTNIVVDSSVKLSSMWGDFDTGNGGVIGGKYGSSKVLMQNVIVAAELDVFSDVTAAYQWYAYRRCGMLVGYTGQNSPKQATNAAADFLTCVNVSVYYGNWTNYTYYQFDNQTDAEDNKLWYSNYPWVRAQESDYNGPFSNVRYGNPVIKGEKINTIELAEANKTGFAAITFNQLYGGGQGVYGTNEHAGVTIYNDLDSAKTIYILNNASWENLKLQYWFRNGEDTWTTNIDGIDMATMYLSTYNVYKVDLPAYVDGFKVVADGDNSVEFTLSDLTDGETYTVSGETHEHDFGDGNKCECGAYKIQKWQLVTDVEDLEIDDKIIIVAVDANYAISIEQATNNRTGFAIVKNDDGTITISNNVQVLTLVAGTTEGTFGLYTGTGYLYAAGSNANNLKTQTTNNVNGDWTITITDGVASIIAEGSSNRNVMQYNPNNGSPIFSCYASASQKAIAIYKLSASEEIMEAHDCNDYAVGENCENNATCTICGEVIENSALGHNYESVVTAATCTKGGYTTHTCSRCGDDNVTDETDALGHTFDGDSCSVCGEAKPTVGGTKTYTFSDYTAGTQYAVGEEHVLDESTTIVTTQCHFTTDLRIYSSDAHNGYAIIKSANPITTIGFNAGEKVDTIVIYGSNDNGATWTEVARVAVTSAYADYTTDLTIPYTWLKLDVAGSNQVRLTSMTLTTTEPCDHNYEPNVTAPTCTADGYTTYTCTECGYSYTDNTVTATGHVNTTTTTVDATCTVAGSITVTCACGETVSTEVIEATGHNYVDGTCTDCGEAEPTEHICESVCATCGKCTDKECTYDVCKNNQCEGHTATPTWTLTDIANIKADDIVVIVWTTSNGVYAISNNNGTGSAPAAVKVTVSGDQLTGDIADNIKWNITNSDGNLTIYPNGTTATWLYCTATNNGVRVGTNTNKTFTIDASSGYLKHTGTSRYLGIYNAQDVRCYTSHTTDNIKNQTLAFYVLTNVGSEGGETPTPEHTCEHVCDECQKCTDTNCQETACADKCNGHSSPTEPSVVLEITPNDFNGTSYAANNNTKTENGYSYTSNQIMLQSNTMQWQKSNGYITISSNDFVKLELKSTVGTFTVTVGGKTITGTTASGITTYDLTGLTGEIKISVGSVLGKTEYLKFYK